MHIKSSHIIIIIIIAVTHHTHVYWQTPGLPTLSQKKSPMFLAITHESIVGFS